MKAIVLEQYGSAELLHYKEVNKPEIEANDLLIEIKAASVNPIDWKIREGYLTRAIQYESPVILGWDAAGIVKDIGPGVTKFSIGDEVFTSPDLRRKGTYAEYVAVNENEVAMKPSNLSFEEAASIPLVGLTAWTGLIDTANMKASDRVLIQAGAGGVGTFAIQLAKSMGCWVAATCSGKNVEFLKELGVDQVINYEVEKFEDVLDPVDIVLETMDGEIQNRSFQVMKKGGHLISTNGPPNMLLAKQYEVKAQAITRSTDGNKLAKISELLENKEILPVVGKVLNLSEIQEAHNLIQTGHTRGKIVLKV